MEFSTKNQLMKYARLVGLKKSNSKAHSKKQYSCGICQSVFSNGAKLWQHRKESHQLELPATESSSIDQGLTECDDSRFQCNFCEKSFMCRSNRLRHTKRAHSQNVLPEQRNGTLKCSECSHAFPSHASFIEHFSSSHPEFDIKKETFSFSSKADFDVWKNKIESETAASYTKKKCNKYKNVKTVIYYNCHRSGNFISQSNNLRQLKRGGSCKINSYCPAQMKIEIKLNTGEGKENVHVEFYSTHIGHECDISYLRIPKDKKYIHCVKMNHKEMPEEMLESTSRDNLGIEFREIESIEENAEASNKSPLEYAALKNDALSAISNLQSIIKNSENDEIFKYVLSAVTKIGHAVNEIKGQSKLIQVINQKTSRKKIQPQSKFPIKKKKQSSTLKPFSKKTEVLKSVLSIDNIEHYEK